MRNPIQILAEIAGQAGLTVVFALFFAALFVYVMTRNYQRMMCEEFRPDLLEGERQIDRLDITGLITSSRTILTDRRVLQSNLSWLFSRRQVVAIGWADTHSVTLKRSLAWIILIAGALVARGVNPAAFLLVLWGLDSRAYTIIFETPFAQMPWTRVRARSRDRAALPELVRFYRSGYAVWAQMRVDKSTAPVIPAPDAIATTDADFVVGKNVWIGVLVVMAAAVLQRLAEGHVGFDSSVFGPIYIAAPVAAARNSRRDGFWVALLGFLGILMVKFPSTGLPGALVNDGGVPYFAQYIGVLITLLLMSEAAAAISRFGWPTLSPLAALLWLPYVAMHMPAVVSDLGLYSRIVAAVGMASLAAILSAQSQYLTLRAGRKV